MNRNVVLCGLVLLIASSFVTPVLADSYSTTALPTIATTSMLDAAYWPTRAGELYPVDGTGQYWTSPPASTYHMVPYPAGGGYSSSILVNWNIDWTKVTGAISSATFSFVTDDVRQGGYVAPSAVDQMAVYPILQSWDATRPTTNLSVDWAHPVIFTGATTVNVDGTNYNNGNGKVWQTTVDIGAMAEQWRQNQTNVYGIVIMPNNYNAAMLATYGTYYTTFDYAHTGADAFQSLTITFAPAQTFLPGDCDKNGVVDDNDLNALLSGWNAGTTWAQGNFKGTGVTDDNDLNALLSNWGKTSGAPVPEPVTMSLLALGGLALLRRRR